MSNASLPIHSQILTIKVFHRHHSSKTTLVKGISGIWVWHPKAHLHLHFHSASQQYFLQFIFLITNSFLVLASMIMYFLVYLVCPQHFPPLQSPLLVPSVFYFLMPESSRVNSSLLFSHQFL